MDPERHSAIAYLSQLIQSDRRFEQVQRRLLSEYPRHFPLERPKLASGIPILMMLDLHDAARSLGLACLLSPSLLLFDVLSNADTEPPRENARLRTQVAWFYKRFSRERTVIQIAEEYAYSDSSVSQGITRIRKVLGAGAGRGRPPAWQRPSKSL